MHTDTCMYTWHHRRTYKLFRRLPNLARGDGGGGSSPRLAAEKGVPGAPCQQISGGSQTPGGDFLIPNASMGPKIMTTYYVLVIVVILTGGEILGSRARGMRTTRSHAKRRVDEIPLHFDGRTAP